MFMPKIEEYPARSINQDVMLRTGVDLANAFTPYSGMYNIVMQHLRDFKALVDVHELVQNIQEYSAVSNKVGDKLEIDEAGEDDFDPLFQGPSHTVVKRLEDVPQKYVERYISTAIISSFRYTGAYLNNLKAATELVGYSDDKEVEDDGKFENELLVQEVYSNMTEDLLDARERLPFVIKQLHQGSIAYKGHLISFIIAYKKLKSDSPLKVIRPGEIIDQGVFSVNKNGEINGLFVDDDNRKPTYQFLFRWIKGEEPDDIYYGYARELLSLCTLLEVDITKEDPKKFTPAFINKLVCSYLMETNEYLDIYKSSISQDKLFAVDNTNKSSLDYLEMSENDEATLFAINSEQVMRVLDSKEEKNHVLPGSDGIKEFFDVYNKKFKGSFRKLSITDYSIRGGYLFNDSRQGYAVLDISNLLSLRKREIKCLIRKNGIIIKIDNDSAYIYYSTIDELTCRLIREMSDEDLWERRLRGSIGL